MDIAQSVRDLYNLRKLRCISTPFSSIIKSNNNNNSVLRSDEDSVMHDVLLLQQNRFINLRFVAVSSSFSCYVCGPITRGRTC